MNFGVEISEYKGKTIGLYGGKFLPFHKGHLDCILTAQSMVDILFVVVGYDEEYDLSLCENSEVKWVSHRVRERWITEELRNFPNIRVLSQYEKRSDDYMTDATVMESYRELLFKIGGKVDKVFSSETSYTEYFERYLPMAEHVVLNFQRSTFNISATKIRTDGVYAHWDMLPKSVQKFYTKRVAICGIESVGKSHLSDMLANYFNTHKVYEYGRKYYEDINGFNDISDPTDYYDIATGHCHILNESVELSNKVMILDTDLTYTQFFHFLETDEILKVIDELVKNRAEKIDKYIYIEPHNFHELDGTRRAVTDVERQRRNHLLKTFYGNYGIELVIVDEKDRNARFRQCAKIIAEEIGL